MTRCESLKKNEYKYFWNLKDKNKITKLQNQPYEQKNQYGNHEIYYTFF